MNRQIAGSHVYDVGISTSTLDLSPAQLRALRRALRRPVAETLAGTGTGGYGSGRLDRLVARSGLLAGTRVPGSVRMGVRNVLLHDAALSLPQEFPPVIPLIALAGVLALTLIVIRGPLRRATRTQPGTALRYQ
jgi:hypothetical protein